MSQFELVPEKEPRTSLLDCLTHVRRRLVLSVLLDRSTPVTERELAAELAEDGQTSAEDVTRRKVHLDLRHVDLPKLAEVGLVNWNRAQGTVTVSDHPALDEAGFRRAIETAADRDDAPRDLIGPGVSYCDESSIGVARASRFSREVSLLLTPGPMNERRRTVLTILETREGPLAVGDLAREVAASEVDGNPSTDAVERVQIRLHHVDLPKLEEAGLVEHDVDDGTVSYREFREGSGLDDRPARR